MARTISYVVGAVLLVLGVWGFIDAPILGLFATNTVHSLVYIIVGALLLYFGYAWGGMSMMVLKVVGILLALLAIVGFAMGGDTLFGVLANSLNDQILHLVAGAVLLWAGFMSGKKEDMPSAPTINNPM
jgi:hypothetical protein